MQSPAPNAPKKRQLQHRPRLKDARAEARLAANESWAWLALFECLQHVVELTIAGITLPDDPS